VSFDAIDRRFKPPKRILLGCAECEAVDGVAMESSRTCYPFDGEPGSLDDPNKDIPLCRFCAERHHSYWDEMWNDYYGSRL
jgi:hypothetical protein